MFAPPRLWGTPTYLTALAPPHPPPPHPFPLSPFAFKVLQQNAAAQQTLMQQQHENDMVLAELERLEDGDGEGKEGDAVFKLMGPALVRQDRPEAVATVRKRLGFIKGELGRLEAGAQEVEKKMGEAQQGLAGLQAEAVKAQGGSATAVGAAKAAAAAAASG